MFSLLGGIWGKLLAFGAIALGILFAFLRIMGQARQAGRDEERAAQSDRNDEARKEAADARADALAVDDPRRELLDRFRRADGQ